MRKRRPIRSENRATLIASIARGRRWLDELIGDPTASTESIAKRESCSVRKVNMTISIAFLAPDLVRAAIDGQLPHGMGVARLADLPAECPGSMTSSAFLGSSRRGVSFSAFSRNRPDAHWLLLRRRLGLAPHYRSPTSAMEPAGQDLGTPLAPEINDSTAPMAPECQSFLDNVVAQRHLIAELPRWNHSRETGSMATACLARSSSHFPKPGD